MPASPAEARLKIELQPMRHLWRGIEADLVRLGVNSLEDLKNRDPGELFQAYCALSGKEFDLCVQDSFTSLVEFAQGLVAFHPRAVFSATREKGAAPGSQARSVLK